MSPVSSLDFLHSSGKLYTRNHFAGLKWMTSFEFTVWPAWEQLVRLQGISSSETISALYGQLVVEQRDQERGEGSPSEQFRSAVARAVRAIPADLAHAVANRKQYMEWAMVTLDHQSEDCDLIEMCPCMQDAMETVIRMQETTLHELSALRAWLKEWEIRLEFPPISAYWNICTNPECVRKTTQSGELPQNISKYVKTVLL